MHNIYSFIKHLDLAEDTTNVLLISSMIHSQNSYYRSFSIPKRKGGERDIDSPYPSLQHVQKLILDKQLSSIPCFQHSYAFTKNKNAIEHARFHLGSTELLTMDIQDYFPSITKDQVFKALIENNIAPQYASFIASLSTLDNKLPQGACTSPLLSNIVFKPIDVRLNNLAKKLSLKYSRYADDLAFSGDVIPRNLISIVSKILVSYGFEVNGSKCKLKVAGAKKIITGVSISGNDLKVPKKFKRELRAKIYELEKNKEHVFLMPNFDPMIYEKVLGKLNYWLQVEPNCAYALEKRTLLIKNYKEFKEE